MALPSAIEAALGEFIARFDAEARVERPRADEYEWAAAHLLAQTCVLEGRRLVKAERRAHLWSLLLLGPPPPAPADVPPPAPVAEPVASPLAEAVASPLAEPVASL